MTKKPRNYSRRISFFPGMPCPGNCGKRLNSKSDCFHQWTMCQPCGAAKKNQYQAERRASMETAICTTPGCSTRFRLADSSYKCAACLRLSKACEPKAPYKCFSGLRGPGGEIEHGPQAYRRWETAKPVHEGPWH